MPITAAAIGAAGSLGGGLLGSKSSKSAAKNLSGTAQNVGNSILNTTNANFGQTQEALGPYLNAGQAGANALLQNFQPGGQLSQQFSFDPSQIKNNPNYQFVLQQGTDAVQKSAAASGGLFSGGTMKALDQYSQGLATNTINDAYAQSANTFQMNHQNLFQGLTALTGLGQTGINQLMTAQGQRLSGTEAGGQAYLTGAGANAAGTLGAGNAWTNALNGIVGNTQAAVNPAGSSVQPGGYAQPTFNPGSGPGYGYGPAAAGNMPPLPVSPSSVYNWNSADGSGA